MVMLSTRYDRIVDQHDLAVEPKRSIRPGVSAPAPQQKFGRQGAACNPRRSAIPGSTLGHPWASKAV